jgi:hypothetical protein
MLKILTKKILYSTLKIFYPKIPLIVLQRWPFSRVLLMGVFQRVFRINSGVLWPVHWSSIVSYQAKINRRYPNWSTPGFNIGQYIQAANGIVLGDRVRLGPGVKLISADHNILDFEKHVTNDPIIIENFCWLGANVVVLPGIKLAEHTIVAAGAIVTKSFLDGDCVIAGVPAKVVKKIDSYKGQRTVDS